MSLRQIQAVLESSSPGVAGLCFLRAPPEEHLSAQNKHLLFVPQNQHRVNEYFDQRHNIEKRYFPTLHYKNSNNGNPNYATSTTTTTTTTRTTTTEKHQKTRTKQISSPVVECNAQAPAGPPDSQKGGRPLQIPEVLSCLFLGLTLLKKSTRPSYYKSVIVFFNRNTPCS